MNILLAALVGVVLYVALLGAGIVLLAKRRDAAPRFYFAATVVAASVAVLELIAQEWLAFGLWTFTTTLAAVNIWTAHRTLYWHRRELAARVRKGWNPIRQRERTEVPS